MGEWATSVRTQGAHTMPRRGPALGRVSGPPFHSCTFLLCVLARLDPRVTGVTTPRPITLTVGAGIYHRHHDNLEIFLELTITKLRNYEPRILPLNRALYIHTRIMHGKGRNNW